MNPALLLADRSPCLRWLVMRHLISSADKNEIRSVERARQHDPLVADLLDLQQTDGSWRHGDGAWRAHSMITCMALTRLGYLGFDGSDEPVKRAADYLFASQREDGSWPLEGGDDDEGVTETPLQTTFPLRALAACGYAEDLRAERAYAWLLERRLDDGAWPTGKAKGDYRRVAGYRRIAHSTLGCRSNTTAVLQCLKLHPRHARSQPAERALDLLLGRETRDAYAFGFDLTRLLGANPVAGFVSFYARYDSATMLALCAEIGATMEDERVRDLVDFVNSLRGPHGFWSNSDAPQCDRWLTYDVLRSLNAIDEEGDWISLEPRTPFQATRQRRY